jgi:5-methyltetrahydrofolate--homocysteine methyltransferase
MKKAVAYLLPFMEEEKAAAAKLRAEQGLPPITAKGRGVVVMATVKGDVHDIGKNIVGVVLGCNNYKVVDVGVMCNARDILQAVTDNDADILGCSGLITPSLDEMVTVAKEMERTGLKVPLLIGGATTSKMHTAVKVFPNYPSGFAMHVLDASRAVSVCESLLNEKKRAEFQADVKEQYEEMREDHYASLASRKFITLEKARSKMLQVDWKAAPPPKPKLLGTKVFTDYPLAELLPYIDWNPFFQVWQLRGKYPNRGYPAIFKDETVGVEAKKLHDDAMALLDEVVQKKMLQAKGVVGIWPANSVGDDIQVYSADGSGATLGTFHTLRQQEEREDSTYYALSDFIAPSDSGVPDYIGAFAVSCGFGCEEVCAQLRSENDDYKGIMMEAVADRLAEAFAELLHVKMRTELWGYAPDEKLSTEDLLKTKYSGIRPAPGYPTQPDHTEKNLMWQLLDAKKATGIELTDSLAMLPAASVSALVFGNPCSTYFQAGKLCKDQTTDYAQRKGMTLKEVEKWMGPYLGYDDAE